MNSYNTMLHAPTNICLADRETITDTNLALMQLSHHMNRDLSYANLEASLKSLALLEVDTMDHILLIADNFKRPIRTNDDTKHMILRQISELTTALSNLD